MERTAGAEAQSGIPRQVNWFVVAGAVVLAAVIAVAIYFSFRFVDEERQRDLQAWQIRLGIVADSRVAAIQEWMDQNFATLRELAQNASLQLYMSELALAAEQTAGAEGQGSPTAEAAEAGYLRNLLTATAERAGFKAAREPADIPANVERIGVAGLGLVDANGVPVVSSPGMPPLSDKIRSGIDQALAGEPALVDVFMGAANQPTIGFALPVYGIQDDEGAKAIGAVVGLRVLDREFFDRLTQPGETGRTAESYLVRRNGNAIDYISPLADGTPPLKRSLAATTEDLAAAFALGTPGGFAVKRDYGGDLVLVVSRPVVGTPWTLVRKVSQAEALAANETRRTTTLVVFVLIIVGVAVTLVAVWRHGTSVRAAEAAEKYRISSERFENISKFMRVVTNNQPLSIVAVSEDTTYTFANEPAGREVGLTPDDMIGKPMAAVIGPAPANFYARVNREVLAAFQRAESENRPDSRDTAKQSHLNEFGEGDDLRVIKSDHVPLRGDRDHPPGVLMVLSDLTDLTLERRRTEHQLRRLIDTLVGVVDRRTPHATDLSMRRAEVARAIAEEMGLDAISTKTVETAAKLLAVGTAFVPVAVLGKESALTPDENDMIGNAHQVSADILKDVPFPGPVVETIRQVAEHWDGSGPLGIRAEEILEPARVLAVATAFINMVVSDPRQDALTFDQAVEHLLAEAGRQFDRRPVAALINILHNRDGAQRWAHFRE